jgi:hypothetical protein
VSENVNSRRTQTSIVRRYKETVCVKDTACRLLYLIEAWSLVEGALDNRAFKGTSRRHVGAELYAFTPS